MVQLVTEHLEGNGGSMPMRSLVSQIAGLKKAQLQQHFYLSPTDQVGNYVVSLTPSKSFVAPGGVAGFVSTFVEMPSQAAALSQVQALDSMEGPAKKRKKNRASADPNAPLEPLDSEKVESISLHLEAHGGTLLLGKLSSAFEGVKKAQLEQHFIIFQGREGNGEWSVSLGQPSAEEFALSTEKAKVRKERKQRDPDAPPPPDLELEKVGEIADFLSQLGGSCSLGKLSTMFEGLKKVQLEPHFQVVRDGDSGSFTVSMHA